MGVSMPLFAVTPSLWLVIPLWFVCSGVGMSCIDASCLPGTHGVAGCCGGVREICTGAAAAELADVVDRDAKGSYGKAYGIAQACRQAYSRVSHPTLVGEHSLILGRTQAAMSIGFIGGPLIGTGVLQVCGIV